MQPIPSLIRSNNLLPRLEVNRDLIEAIFIFMTVPLTVLRTSHNHKFPQLL